MSGFDLYFPLEHLKAALVVSLLSVAVLVGLFAYLNRFTHRQYFSIWTVGWLFYALWIVLHISAVDGSPNPLIEMGMNWSISFCAVFLIWGSSGFMGEKVHQIRLALFIVFLMVWGAVSAYEYRSDFFKQAAIYGFAGVTGLQNGILYLDYRKSQGHVGAGLLGIGFLLWGFFLAAYPYLYLNAHLIPATFFISAILQLYIAVGMVVLILQEMRCQEDQVHQTADAYKQETDALRSKVEATEERYRHLFERASEAIILARLSDRRILEMNLAARKLLSWPESENQFPPMEVFCRSIRVADGKGAQTDWFHQVIDSGKITLTRRDGKSVPVEAGGSEVRWMGTEAFQLYFRELTEKEKLEQQLRQAEKLSALGHMISGVAHELNNPLAVVKGYLELVLAHHDLTDKTRKDLEKVAYESNRAAKLVSNFLSFAREQPAHRENVQLNDILNRIVEMRRFDLRLSDIKLVMELDRSLPETWVDPDQMQQVYVNLIENAIHVLKHKKGEKTVRIQSYSEKGAIIVVIEDNGPGIDEKVAPHIFEPFYTTKEVGSGTGLGLSIAYSIMSDHQGQITFYPVESGGAGFILSLPVCNSKGPAPASDKSSVPGAILPATSANTHGGKDKNTILVLDDEVLIAQLLAEILSTLGYKTAVSDHPRDALARASKNQFDLVVSDFRMPQMDGAGFFRELIRANPIYKDRVIFITGDVVNEETQSFLQSLPNPSLGKPFRIKEVEEVVGAVMKRLNPSEP